MSLTLLPGFKFVPSDVELIGFYLYNRVHNLPFSCDIVQECDLYGTLEPWQIWEIYGGPKLGNQDLYFFTPLKKLSNKGSRFCRRVGSGTWKGQNGATEIKDEETQMTIGSKKWFRYENKCSEHNGGWIMHEYTLFGHDEFVVCRIRKNENDEEAVVKKGKRKSVSKEGEVEKHLSKRSRVEENPVHSQWQSVDEKEGEPQSECEETAPPPELLVEEVYSESTITDDGYSSFLENFILTSQPVHEHEPEAGAESEAEPYSESEAPSLSVWLRVGEEFFPEITNYYYPTIDEVFPGENFTDLLM